MIYKLKWYKINQIEIIYDYKWYKIKLNSTNNGVFNNSMLAEVSVKLIIRYLYIYCKKQVVLKNGKIENSRSIKQ